MAFIKRFVFTATIACRNQFLGCCCQPDLQILFLEVVGQLPLQIAYFLQVSLEASTYLQPPLQRLAIVVYAALFTEDIDRLYILVIPIVVWL